MQFLYIMADIRCEILDIIFKTFTLLGEEVFVMALICLLYWCADKRLAYRIGMSFFASGLLVQGLKITFRVDRPWIIDPDFKPIESALETATGYSFPSGHTQSASSLFTSLALYLKKTWITIISIVIIPGVALSRMYLGVHTPTDVITSLAISVTLSILVDRLMSCVENDKKYDLPITAAIILISGAVMAYSLILFTNGTIEGRYAADCIKAASAGMGFGIGFCIERKLDISDTKISLPKRLLKLTFGLLGLLAVKEIPSLIADNIVTDAAAYLLLPIWVLAVYPLIWEKASKTKR